MPKLDLAWYIGEADATPLAALGDTRRRSVPWIINYYSANCILLNWRSFGERDGNVSVRHGHAQAAITFTQRKKKHSSTLLRAKRTRRPKHMATTRTRSLSPRESLLCHVPPRRTFPDTWSDRAAGQEILARRRTYVRPLSPSSQPPQPPVVDSEAKTSSRDSLPSGAAG